MLSITLGAFMLTQITPPRRLWLVVRTCLFWLPCGRSPLTLLDVIDSGLVIADADAALLRSPGLAVAVCKRCEVVLTRRLWRPAVRVNGAVDAHTCSASTRTRKPSRRGAAFLGGTRARSHG